MQARGGTLTAAASSGGAGGPPGAAPSWAPGRRARGGGRPRALQPPPRLEPSLKSFTAGGGVTSRERSHPSLPRQDPSDGRGGRRKSFSAESTEPTGLHPASTVRCRHKAAPPPPLLPPPPLPPPPQRPTAGPGRGLGRPGVGGAGEAAAAQAGRLLPCPGERARAWKRRAPACPGGGGGGGGGCLPRNPRQI